MKIVNYLKRMIKYVLYDYKQPIVKAEIKEFGINKIHENKIYLITGGGSGLGYDIAKSLINSGAKVIITGRNEKKLMNAVNTLGENCEYLTIDITDIDKCNIALDNLYKKYKKIDGLINNAGVSLHENNFEEVSVENYNIQFDTNLKGAYFLSQKYIELYHKHKQKKGNIIFISSERGSMCDDLPYGLTKVAINSLTQALSLRYNGDGIRVNAIAPGVTCSPLVKKEKNDDLYLNKTAGRYLLPEEISNVVNFILSDFSSAISGEIINCDVANHLKCYFKD